MGSKKKRASKSQALSTPQQMPGTPGPCMPQELSEWLGFPAFKLNLAPAEASAGRAVLRLPTKEASRCGTNPTRHCLVGLAGVSQSVNGGDSPPVAARLSFEQNTTQSSTSPSNRQTRHPLQLLSLWDWYSQHNGLQLQQPDTAQLGTYVYAAEVESSASLLQGTCSLSGSFFQHSHGHESAVAVYSSPQYISCTEVNSLANITSQKAKPDVVYARMLLDTATGLPAALPQGTPSKPSPSTASPQSSWALRALKQNSAKQTDMLQSVLAKHLQGHALLAGNPVLVPVLGHNCIFRIEHISGCSAYGQPYTVQLHTQVRILQPDEPLNLPPEAMKPPLQLAPQASEAVSAARDIVAEARVAAAAGHEEESQGGAAGQVAARAASLGLQAASTGYASLGGVEHHVKALRELVTLPLKHPQLFTRYNIRPPRGVLLWGPPGTGKTCLARAAAAEVGVPLFVINGPDVVSQYMGESEAGLQGIFTAARAMAPSVIFIDELDALAPARGRAEGGGGGAAPEPADEMMGRIVTTLLTAMDGINSGEGQVVVIAATNRPDALDSALRRPGRFDRELEVGVPSPQARAHILRTKLKGLQHSLSEEEIDSLAAAAHGFVGSDLAAICNEAAMAALRRHITASKGPLAQGHAATRQAAQGPAFPHNTIPTSPALRSLEAAGPTSPILAQHKAKLHQQPNLQGDLDQASAASMRCPDEENGLMTGDEEQSAAGADCQAATTEVSQQDRAADLRVTLADFKVAETRVQPSAMREVGLEVPKVQWGDVGGLEGVKQRLKEAVQWPHLQPEALARLGAEPPKGVLLYGPPGCSKTLLARAVATEAKLNFLAVKGPELFSKYVGQAEKAIAALFAKARAAAPAIIFFDEIDGLAGTRGSESGSGVGERVLSQLLMEMDGLQARVGVVVIGATNRPDHVDMALLRPGRFDRLLYVPPPDADARQAILAVHTRHTPLAHDVSLQNLAQISEGFTGADLAAVVREAALAALTESLSADTVTTRHFDQAFQVVHGSIPPAESLQSMYGRVQRHGMSK